jgi:tetratricopeptide (TPR) repeat protein
MHELSERGAVRAQGGPPPDRSPEDERPEVVVEPFDNLTGDAHWDALGRGAAEAIRAALRTMREIRVADAGASAGSVWVVGGSVQRVGQKLRLAAQLRVIAGAVASEPIEVDADPDQPAMLLDLLRGRALDEARLLWREHDRRSRADRGTRSEAARARLHQYYSMTGPAIQPEQLDAGKELLDAALAADPEYVPALVERGYLQALGAAVRGAREGVSMALEDLRRALAAAPGDPRALVMQCRVSQVAVQIADDPSDADIRGAVDACNAAMQADPSSAYIPFVLARLHDLRCDDDMAMASLGQVMELDRSLSGRALEHLVLLALQNGRTAVADRMSQRLVELQEEEARLGARALSRRAGVSPVSGAHMRRAAVLMRRGALDDARALLERELENVAAGLGSQWTEPAAIRGILRIARERGAPAPAALVQRLAQIESDYAAAAARDPNAARVIAGAYQWSDPEAAVVWLDRLDAPPSIMDALSRALFYYTAGDDDAARRALAAHRPREAWHKACAAWLHSRMAHRARAR